MMREMLLEKGIDFDKHYPEFFRKGTYFRRELREMPLPASVPERFRNENETMLRSRIIRVKDMPWKSTAEQLAYFK
jgi:hypothetical protein